MCVITAALKVCPWNSHACAFKFLSEIRLQSQNWTQPLKMTSWGALPATGDVKTKCQQSFQAFLGNEMTPRRLKERGWGCPLVGKHA